MRPNPYDPLKKKTKTKKSQKGGSISWNDLDGLNEIQYDGVKQIAFLIAPDKKSQLVKSIVEFDKERNTGNELEGMAHFASTDFINRKKITPAFETKPIRWPTFNYVHDKELINNLIKAFSKVSKPEITIDQSAGVFYTIIKNVLYISVVSSNNNVLEDSESFDVVQQYAVPGYNRLIIDFGNNNILHSPTSFTIENPIFDPYTRTDSITQFDPYTRTDSDQESKVEINLLKADNTIKILLTALPEDYTEPEFTITKSEYFPQKQCTDLAECPTHRGGKRIVKKKASPKKKKAT